MFYTLTNESEKKKLVIQSFRVANTRQYSLTYSVYHYKFICESPIVSESHTKNQGLIPWTTTVNWSDYKWVLVFQTSQYQINKSQNSWFTHWDVLDIYKLPVKIWKHDSEIKKYHLCFSVVVKCCLFWYWPLRIYESCRYLKTFDISIKKKHYRLFKIDISMCVVILNNICLLLIDILKEIPPVCFQSCPV